MVTKYTFYSAESNLNPTVTWVQLFQNLDASKCVFQNDIRLPKWANCNYDDNDDDDNYDDNNVDNYMYILTSATLNEFLLLPLPALSKQLIQLRVLYRLIWLGRRQEGKCTYLQSPTYLSPQGHFSG